MKRKLVASLLNIYDFCFFLHSSSLFHLNTIIYLSSTREPRRRKDEKIKFSIENFKLKIVHARTKNENVII